ncbi:hypothetical protein [Massilia sp. CCM 8734]|uniref:hypothetical protein n=1 Tax=Massilia sp. CCM 8734 TaxID=2609283 RepID=UPI00141FC5E2|nr:hypothetical protein [Massilia sp. CCM 8734]NHZ97463.1 hypothetical protein [Massilia sp. CCM 8734]
MNISNIKVGGGKCQSSLVTSTAISPILAELRHADYIIGAMLNAMTPRQKAKVHEQLVKAGVSGEGMTRANERSAVIEVATATVAASPTAAPIHLTEDGRRMLAAYRALNKDLQGFCLGIALSMAVESRARNKRPALHLVPGGAV